MNTRGVNGGVVWGDDGGDEDKQVSMLRMLGEMMTGMKNEMGSMVGLFWDMMEMMVGL